MCRDPRDTAIVAFGGAGPAHAVEVARILGITKVIVPFGAGVASAIGALTAPMAGAVRETKALLLEAGGRTLEEQRRYEREAQIRRFRELARAMAR